MKRKTTILVIMPRECRLSLLVALEGCDIEAYPASDRTEAKQILGSHYSIQAVVTGTNLPEAAVTPYR